jgi:hypothetical protein
MDLTPRFSIPTNTYNPGIPEDRGIKRRGLFGLIIKPQTWGNLLQGWHDASPRWVNSRLRMTVTTSESFAEARNRQRQTKEAINVPRPRDQLVIEPLMVARRMIVRGVGKQSDFNRVETTDVFNHTGAIVVRSTGAASQNVKRLPTADGVTTDSPNSFNRAQRARQPVQCAGMIC